MKRIASSLVLFALGFSFLSTAYREEIITLPITEKPGYGGMPPGFNPLRITERVDSTWMRTKNQLTGIPKDWIKVGRNQHWLDAKQFTWQNYKAGNLSEKDYNEYQEAWQIDPTKKLYSDKPIKCYFNVLVGKDKGEVIKCKVDTDNDLDFSDETEFAPFFLTNQYWKSLDSIAQHHAIPVQYEAFRNGQTTNLSVPVLIVRTEMGVMINVAQHSEATLEGKTIKMSSDAFSTTCFGNTTLAINPTTLVSPEVVTGNEFIIINGTYYQNLGVDANLQVLKLRKTSPGEIVYSSQPGFYAKPFKAIEFTSKKDIALEDYFGKFVFVEFWGTWCSPCRAELPNLKMVYRELDHSKIEFLGVASDTADKLRDFLDKDPIAWKQILCESETEGIIADYNVNSFPTSFLIDPKGKIVAKNIRGENLSDTLKYYLNRY